MINTAPRIPVSVEPPKEQNIAGRLETRYARILKDLLKARRVPPGEQVVTASAKNFIQKRAALQEKNAGIADAFRNMFKGLSTASKVEKTVAAAQKARAAALSSARAAGATADTAENIAKRLEKYTLERGLPTKEPATSLLNKALSPGGLLLGGSLIGLGHLGQPLFERIGFGARATAYPDLYSRMRMDEEAAQSFAKSVGSQVGDKAVGLLGDVLSKAVGIPSNIMQQNNQQSLFDTLSKGDEVLSQARPEDLEEAYHTMARFAPTLATDANAVRTFLRESTLYGTGPNFTAIKQLADAERAVDPQTLSRGSR